MLIIAVEKFSNYGMKLTFYEKLQARSPWAGQETKLNYKSQWKLKLKKILKHLYKLTDYIFLPFFLSAFTSLLECSKHSLSWC